MSLLNPAILTGFALAAIPVILHLLMRQRPKKLLFPALRLIQARRKNNVRRLRLRHFWLLLLRVLVIGLLVAALTRPSLPAADYEPSLGEWVTTAALVALALMVYQGMLRFWERERTPNHVLAYRRSMLRGAVGAGLGALLLLFVVWPYARRISAEITSPLPKVDRNLPVAAVFVFDTSLSMSYRLHSKTRLEVAQEIASEHLEKLPQGSRVAIADTSTANAILFQGEQGGAQERLSALKTKAVSLKLNDRIRAAIGMQEDDFKRTQSSQESVPEELRTDRFLREIYLFTDLAATAWRPTDAQELLKKELERLPWLQVYLIDVGVEGPTNVGISAVRLSSQTVSIGGELSVDLGIESVGAPGAEAVVELHVQNDKRNLVKREQRSVKVEGSSQSGMTFTVPGISAPITHGEVRLVASDPFQADDIRYFTIAAVAAPEVLIVSSNPAESNLWRQALAPAELTALGKTRYRCTEIDASKLDETDLRPYQIVCLVSVRSPSEEAWRKLDQFVSAGGGLTVIVGHRDVDPVAYNTEAAQTFLPASLAGHIRFQEPAHLDLRDFTNPMFAKFEHFDGGFGPLATVDIRRCWSVSPLQGASVVANYNDARALPAIVEKVHGKGRTVMLTTAVDRGGWSDLPLAEFRFLALADQMMQHLGRRNANVYNYIAGDEVILHLDPEQPLNRYLLRKPGFEQLPGELPVGAEVLSIRDADQVGQFEVIAAENEPPFSSGFSVNGSPDESRFERIGGPELDNLLGAGRYSLAQNSEGLTRNVQHGRIGEEIYPLVLMGVILVFCAE
ncbi:MAG: BatA domain-containing protein, partial [Planctomycetaceae bacterium]